MNKRLNLTIFLLAFAARFAAGWHALREPVLAWCNDATIYHRLAGELLQGRFPSLFRTPGYPLFLALTGALTSERATFALVLQMALDAMTAALLAGLAWRLFRDVRAAWLAGLFYAFCPVAIGLTAFVVSEPLGTFLVVAATALALARPSRLTRAAQVVCWFAAVMVRPSFALLPLIVGVFFVINRELKVRLKSQAIVIAAYLCCLALWVGFNYARSGMAVISTNPEVSFYIYDTAAVRMVDELSWPGYVKAALLNPPEYDRLLEAAQRRITREVCYDSEPMPESLWFTMDNPELIRRIGGRAKAITAGRLPTIIGVHAVGAVQTLRPRWNSAAAINRILDALRVLLLPLAVVLLARRRQWWLWTFVMMWTAYAILPPGPVGAWRFRSLAEPLFSLTLAAAFAPLCFPWWVQFSPRPQGDAAIEAAVK